MIKFTEKSPTGKNCIPLKNAAQGIDLPKWSIHETTFLESRLEGDAADQLAAYESTGLEPDEIPHWISVSEKLPKESEYRNGNRYKFMDSNELVPLLVCCKDTEIPFRAFYNGKNWGDGWSKVDVICWMPLPQPPKEEK